MVRTLGLSVAVWLSAFSLAAGQKELVGEWSGRYDCAQGTTGLRLVIAEATPANARALFHFFPLPENPGVPEGCFTLDGSYDRATGTLDLRGGEWLLRPAGYVTVDFRGQVDALGGRFSGRVVGPGCTEFDLVRGTPASRPVPPECGM